MTKGIKHKPGLLQQAYDWIADHPDVTNGEVGERFDISPSVISRIRNVPSNYGIVGEPIPGIRGGSDRGGKEMDVPRYQRCFDYMKSHPTAKNIEVATLYDMAESTVSRLRNHPHLFKVIGDPKDVAKVEDRSNLKGREGVSIEKLQEIYDFMKANPDTHKLVVAQRFSIGDSYLSKIRNHPDELGIVGDPIPGLRGALMHSKGGKKIGLGQAAAQKLYDDFAADNVQGYGALGKTHGVSDYIARRVTREPAAYGVVGEPLKQAPFGAVMSAATEKSRAGGEGSQPRGHNKAKADRQLERVKGGAKQRTHKKSRRSALFVWRYKKTHPSWPAVAIAKKVKISVFLAQRIISHPELYGIDPKATFEPIEPPKVEEAPAEGHVSPNRYESSLHGESVKKAPDPVTEASDIVTDAMKSEAVHRLDAHNDEMKKRVAADGGETEEVSGILATSSEEATAPSEEEAAVMENPLDRNPVRFEPANAVIGSVEDALEKYVNSYTAALEKAVKKRNDRIAELEADLILANDENKRLQGVQNKAYSEVLRKLQERAGGHLSSDELAEMFKNMGGVI